MIVEENHRAKDAHRRILMFPVWQSVDADISDFRTVDDFHRTCALYGIEITDWAKGMLDSLNFFSPSARKRVELVKTTLSGLGLTSRSHPRGEICEKAFKFGLDFCEPEDGPRLVLAKLKERAPDLVWQDRKWPHENCVVCSRPMMATRGRRSPVLSVLYFYRSSVSGKLCFDGEFAYGNSHWLSSCQVVFRRREICVFNCNN